MITYSSDQFIFDRSIGGLGIALKVLLTLAAYSPLWFTGYILTTFILQPEASAFAWIGLTALFGFIILMVVLAIKQLISQLMKGDNLLWIPLFLICFSYTCIAPVWWGFDYIHQAMEIISAPYANLLTWIAAPVLVIILYCKYNFLSSSD